MTFHTDGEIIAVLTGTSPVVALVKLPSDDEFTVAQAAETGLRVWGVCNGFEIQDLEIPWSDLLKYCCTPREWMTLSDAADALDISDYDVLDLVVRGQLEAMTHGRQLWILKRSVREVMDA